MKLIIDIPEEMYEQIKDGYVPLGISKYLKNGIPLDDVLDKTKGYVEHIRNTGMGKKKSLNFIEKYIEGLKAESEEDKEVWCTECPYFKYVADDMDDSWYGARCNKDCHEANPSMYAIQSLHEDCPLRNEVEHE